MDLKTNGQANSNENRDVLISLDSASDPIPGANTGTIINDMKGNDSHIMAVSGLGIKTASHGVFVLFYSVYRLNVYIFSVVY